VPGNVLSFAVVCDASPVNGLVNKYKKFYISVTGCGLCSVVLMNISSNVPQVNMFTVHAHFVYIYSDDYDSELIADDDSKPLTQDELKNKVMKLVSPISQCFVCIQ